VTPDATHTEAAAQDGGDAGIKIIGRAVAVLRALAGEREGLSISQLAERTGLPRSTIHRLVSALEVEGVLVAASVTGRVRIGPELVRLAEAGRRFAPCSGRRWSTLPRPSRNPSTSRSWNPAD